jgi:hypothetical protein
MSMLPNFAALIGEVISKKPRCGWPREGASMGPIEKRIGRGFPLINLLDLFITPAPQ